MEIAFFGMINCGGRRCIAELMAEVDTRPPISSVEASRRKDRAGGRGSSGRYIGRRQREGGG